MKELKGVEDTLLIPLTARIYVSKRFPQFFYDEKALEIEKSLPENIIEKKSGEYFMMASVARYHYTDQQIEQFIEECNGEDKNIVFLGVGLETAYYRIKTSEAIFYNVDLPQVIKKREEILKVGEKEVCIEGDMFALEWTKEIKGDRPTLFVVSGVFQYFKEEKIIEFIRNLQRKFPKGQIVFDCTDEKGIEMANKYVRKTGNKEAQMSFYINDTEEFLGKVGGVRLVEQVGFYEDALRELKKSLEVKTKVFMYFADKWGRTKIMNIQLNNQ